MLSSLTLLMNRVGIKTGWRVIRGAPDSFAITKKMHNAVHGGEINLTVHKGHIYENVIYRNSVSMDRTLTGMSASRRAGPPAPDSKSAPASASTGLSLRTTPPF